MLYKVVLNFGVTADDKIIIWCYFQIKGNEYDFSYFAKIKLEY